MARFAFVRSGCALSFCLGLAACNKPTPNADGLEGRGHYLGVGIYPAGRMWSQITGADTSSNAAAAKLRDDEQVIVVVDANTGELRQCGNLSGVCVAMNPWRPGAIAQAPAALLKHAEDLAHEAAEVEKAKGPAAH